jgi:formylglycine-generating enzyme required for sulfatase activity
MRRIGLLFLINLCCNIFSYSETRLIFVDRGTLSPVWGNSIQIEMDGFFISDRELTVSDWKKYLSTTGYNYNWSRSNHSLSPNSSPNTLIENDDWPMYNVTWLEAVEYCNWLSRNEGYSEVYSISGNEVYWDRTKEGYRLPTELEWEYAAKGGDVSIPTKFSGSNNVDEVAWYGDNSGGYPNPVKQKKPNILGLFDMSGNVGEWCWDFYEKDYIPSQENKYGPLVGNAYETIDSKENERDLKVVRGGTCLNSMKFCDIEKRGASYLDDRAMVGFRIVLDAGEQNNFSESLQK